MLQSVVRHDLRAILCQTAPWGAADLPHMSMGSFLARHIVGNAVPANLSAKRRGVSGQPHTTKQVTWIDSRARENTSQRQRSAAKFPRRGDRLQESQQLPKEEAIALATTIRNISSINEWRHVVSGNAAAMNAIHIVAAISKVAKLEDSWRNEPKRGRTEFNEVKSNLSQAVQGREQSPLAVTIGDGKFDRAHHAKARAGAGAARQNDRVELSAEQSASLDSFLEQLGGLETSTDKSAGSQRSESNSSGREAQTEVQASSLSGCEVGIPVAASHPPNNTVPAPQLLHITTDRHSLDGEESLDTHPTVNELLDTLMHRFVSGNLPRRGGREFGNVLWALGKIGYVPSAANALWSQAGQRVQHMEWSHLSQSMYGTALLLGRLGNNTVSTEEGNERVEAGETSFVAGIDESDVSGVAFEEIQNDSGGWVGAKGSMQSESHQLYQLRDFVSRITAAEVTRRLDAVNMENNDVSKAPIHAESSLSMGSVVMPQHLANMAWAVASCGADTTNAAGVLPQEVTAFLSKIEQESVSQLAAAKFGNNLQVSLFKPYEVTMLTWSFARARQRCPSLEAAVADYFCTNAAAVEQLKGQHVANLMWSAARLGWTHQSLLQTVQSRVSMLADQTIVALQQALQDSDSQAANLGCLGKSWTAEIGSGGQAKAQVAVDWLNQGWGSLESAKIATWNLAKWMQQEEALSARQDFTTGRNVLFDAECKREHQWLPFAGRPQIVEIFRDPHLPDHASYVGGNKHEAFSPRAVKSHATVQGVSSRQHEQSQLQENVQGRGNVQKNSGFSAQAKRYAQPQSWPPSLKPQEVANAIWSLASLKTVLADTASEKGLTIGPTGESILAASIGWESSSEVSRIKLGAEDVSSLATEKLLSVAKLYTALSVLAQNSQHVGGSWLRTATLKPRELASILWAALQLNKASQELLEASERLLLSYADTYQLRVPLPELIQCGYVYAQAGFRSPAFLSRLAHRLVSDKHGVGRLTDLDCVMALWTFGRQCWNDEQVQNVLTARLMEGPVVSKQVWHTQSGPGKHLRDPPDSRGDLARGLTLLPSDKVAALAVGLATFGLGQDKACLELALVEAAERICETDRRQCTVSLSLASTLWGLAQMGLLQRSPQLVERAKAALVAAQKPLDAALLEKEGSSISRSALLQLAHVEVLLQCNKLQAKLNQGSPTLDYISRQFATPYLLPRQTVPKAMTAWRLQTRHIVHRSAKSNLFEGELLAAVFNIIRLGALPQGLRSRGDHQKVATSTVDGAQIPPQAMDDNASPAESNRSCSAADRLAALHMLALLIPIAGNVELHPEHCPDPPGLFSTDIAVKNFVGLTLAACSFVVQRYETDRLSPKVLHLAFECLECIRRSASVASIQPTPYNRIGSHEQYLDLNKPPAPQYVADGKTSLPTLPSLAIEADGWTHFSANAPFRPTLQTDARNQVIKSCGWQVLEVPIFEWCAPEIAKRREEYLCTLLFWSAKDALLGQVSK